MNFRTGSSFQMTHNLFFAEKLKFGIFRCQLETLKISFWSDILLARKLRLKSRNRSVSEDILKFWKHRNEFVTSEESLQISTLTYGLSEFYSICSGFFKMGYANDNITDWDCLDLAGGVRTSFCTLRKQVTVLTSYCLFYIDVSFVTLSRSL